MLPPKILLAMSSVSKRWSKCGFGHFHSFIYLIFSFICLTLKLASFTSIFSQLLIIWQLFHHFCSSEAEHKGIRSPEGWWKRRTGQNCQKVHWSASTAVSSHSISVLCLLSTVVWSKMNPIVLAAKALSVPFCLHLHSQHLKKTHASVGLNLTRVTSRCCILSAKQGSHCSSTPEDSFPEKLWLFELCM